MDNKADTLEGKCLLALWLRQSEIEEAPPTRDPTTLHANLPPKLFHDTPHDGQAQPMTLDVNLSELGEWDKQLGLLSWR